MDVSTNMHTIDGETFRTGCSKLIRRGEGAAFKALCIFKNKCPPSPSLGPWAIFTESAYFPDDNIMVRTHSKSLLYLILV